MTRDEFLNSEYEVYNNPFNESFVWIVAKDKNGEYWGYYTKMYPDDDISTIVHDEDYPPSKFSLKLETIKTFVEL